MEMSRRASNKSCSLLKKRWQTRKSALPSPSPKATSASRPHNANPILTEWLTGVYHARVMNLYQRHGARVKIATAADFNGTRWTTNALIHQMPGGVSYLLPAGAVARLVQTSQRHAGRRRQIRSHRPRHRRQPRRRHHFPARRKSQLPAAPSKPPSQSTAWSPRRNGSAKSPRKIRARKSVRSIRIFSNLPSAN